MERNQNNQDFIEENGNEMISVSKTSGNGGGYVKNGILRSSLIPGFDEKGIWSAPDGNFILDINKEDLTDEMTIHIKYLGQNIQFKLEKMKGDN